MNPKNNPNNLELNSKWTSVKPLLGWRHFRIVMRRYRSTDGLGDKVLELELMAACDKNARCWVAASELKTAENFRQGWLKDSELNDFISIPVKTRDFAGEGLHPSPSPGA